MESNHPEEAIAYCDEALVAAREHGDPWDELNALQFLALNCSLGGETERGLTLGDEALAGARRLGNVYLVGQALFNAGLARVQTEPEVAVRLLEEAEVASRTHNPNRLGQAALFRGIAHLHLRQIEDAARALRQSLPLMQETGSDFFTSTAIGTATGVIARSSPGAAVQLLAALDRYFTEAGIAGAPDDVSYRQRTRARVEESLGPDAFADAWAQGAAMSIDEAAALAHDELGKLDV